ncbi:MAG: hypothetical protein A2887_04335 [Alphaproteobacteria bacterium RIFCSPLOWO2_01_FULL_40_26]|nr:MAG: hypothetical protein A3D15_01520 [Alphaproteobacteria bacterium RIFCSPHIGHO2_02_FULL_40_34]OFW94453.1 MAG: hypothetical protein A2887_04335 [Alphaproteobacteria bacterium RIFCSPLOWO2_01_FULL_40_26]OFX09523.1 MAG: hypothetical protein A3H30_05535 [Alphaproteobacteria bacterium RIFCSPLOWO2_02_FULL_40_19]OFX10673.1 MAG: hypothetical protein A3G22_06795 [Alphaproteobacteria bacterium RIFCSPLOWO2_12_FULL_40_11]
MKSTLPHLPQEKQNELQKIISTIRTNCDDVEMIILYGSYARGDYVEFDQIDENKPGFRQISDYDILAVTALKETVEDVLLWSKISKLCHDFGYKSDPRISVYDIEFLNIKLSEGQYFFSDIKDEGVVLYDSKKFRLAEKRDLTLQEQKRIARDYFEEWFVVGAEGFMRHYNYAMKDCDYRKSAFFLHQAAEHAYKSTLLILSNKCPQGHFLKHLGNDAKQICSLMENIFSITGKREENRFNLLEYAYIGGRYDPHFRIFLDDLELLAAEARRLLDLARKVCEEKIRSFDL